MSELRDAKSRKARTAFIEEEVGTGLASVVNAFLDDEKDVHCENLIGAVTIPLGVAGPLKFADKPNESAHYIPLATTEGALVASVNRGCLAIAESGGVNVEVSRVGTTRGPVFRVENIAQGRELEQWIREHEPLLKEHAESTSHHLHYIKSDIRRAGEYVFLRIYFDTEQAMGMNMVTIATQRLVELIEHETGIRCLSVAGNFDIDKKPAWLNFLNNRGFTVAADVVLKKTVVEQVLKTSPRDIFEVWLGKCMVGSAMSGALGFNAHFANIVAAFFAATGQDLAHVVEGSHGMSTFRISRNGDLYMSIYLPAVMIAAVGGGTKLKTQKEAIGITGASQVEDLARILGGAVLAGELSLMASLAEHSLAKVHKKLGR